MSVCILVQTGWKCRAQHYCELAVSQLRCRAPVGTMSTGSHTSRALTGRTPANKAPLQQLQTVLLVHLCIRHGSCKWTRRGNSNSSLKQVLVIELSILWEYCMEEGIEQKGPKYQEPTQCQIRGGWRKLQLSTHCWVGPSLCKAYILFGIVKAAQRKDVKTTKEAAARASMWWSRRGAPEARDGVWITPPGFPEIPKTPSQ